MVVTASAGTNVIKLYGTNDTANETWTEVASVSVTATGTTGTTFRQPFRFYRLGYISGTSISFSAYLVESVFELAHIYLTLHMIFRYQAGTPADIWNDKAKLYWDFYQDQINTIIASEDLNENETIDLGEESRLSRTRFRR
jgi:hypothetical protein